MIIGTQWATVATASGKPRIKNPRDVVRVEIETALGRGIPVIPVLIDQARLPTPVDLPKSLRPLLLQQAISVRHENFERDARELVSAVRKLLPSPMGIRRGSHRVREVEELSGRLEYMAACVEAIKGTTKEFRGIFVGPLLLHPDWYFSKRDSISMTPNFDRELKEFVKGQSATRTHSIRLLFRNTARYREKIMSVISQRELPRLKADILKSINEIWGTNRDRGPDVCCRDIGHFRLELLFEDLMIVGMREGSGTPIGAGVIYRNPKLMQVERAHFDRTFNSAAAGQRAELRRLIRFVNSL